MALKTSLISHWSLEEASGNRADDFGSNTLTDNNTVTQNTGKVGNAGQFTAANTETLSVADNAGLSVTDVDFTIAGWIYLDSLGAVRTWASKSTDPTDRGWAAYINSDDKAHFVVRNSGDSAYVDVTASTFGALSVSTWYFIICDYDSTGDTIGISVNNGTRDTAALAGGTRDTAVDFILGADSVTNDLWNGRIDEVAFWKKLLSVSDKAAIYNSGNGLAWTSWDATGGFFNFM